MKLPILRILTYLPTYTEHTYAQDGVNYATIMVVLC